MANKKTKKTEPEEVDVQGIVDDVNDGETIESETTVEDYENLDSDIKSAERDKQAADDVNMVTVSDLQPKRSKPGYPQELKNNAGFGYNPSNK